MNAEARKRISEAQKKRWAAKRGPKVSMDKLILPEGVKIGPKPDLLEMYMKGRGTGDKWINYVRALQSLGATETLQLDLAGVDDAKRHAKAAVNGIRKTALQMGYHKKVKFALINNILHITV